MTKKKNEVSEAFRKFRERRGVALVDVEIMLWQVCMENLEEEHVGHGQYTWTLDSDKAFDSLSTRITDAANAAMCRDVVLAVGSPNSWRRRLCPEYKSNRDGKKKPLGYRALIERARTEFKTVSMDWLEADDVLGVLMTGEHAEHGVIVSSDKDMRTVPGRLYNPAEPDQGVVTRSTLQADAEHAVRALAGDVGDGYKGCSGIGEKKAAEALAGAKDALSLWKRARLLFELSGHDDAYAVEQFRLARVLRSGEYDAKTKQVVLWQPPAGSVVVVARPPVGGRAGGGGEAAPLRKNRRVGRRAHGPGKNVR